MLVFAQKPDEHYYATIDAPGPSILVLGEMTEHWTAQTVAFLEKNNPQVFFFPWSKIPDIRLQMSLTRYPVTQLWRGRELVSEVVGYQEELLEGLARKFFQSKR